MAKKRRTLEEFIEEAKVGTEVQVEALYVNIYQDGFHSIARGEDVYMLGGNRNNLKTLSLTETVDGERKPMATPIVVMNTDTEAIEYVANTYKDPYTVKNIQSFSTKGLDEKAHMVAFLDVFKAFVEGKYTTGFQDYRIEIYVDPVGGVVETKKLDPIEKVEPEPLLQALPLQ